MPIIMILLILCFVFLIVGLIKPRMVIRWGDDEKKTRKKVIAVFLSAFVGITLLGMLISPRKDTSVSTNTNISTENVSKENIENNELKVVDEKDGIVTYSDGSVVKETIGGTFKWTAAYKEIENKEKIMKREEQCDILGKNELIILEEKILDEKKIKEVVTIARECGVNPHMFNGSYWSGENQIYIVRVKKGMLTDDIQYGVKFNEVADIRMANPDTVVKEMENTIKTLANKMPDYVQIELHKRTPESYKPIGELKEIVPGQISEISLTYYKKSNVITKMVSVKREPTENKVKGAIYVLYDVVK